jgi:hypothetical protein
MEEQKKTTKKAMTHSEIRMSLLRINKSSMDEALRIQHM